MSATRARAVLLGLALALCAAVSPAAASLPGHGFHGASQADELVLDLLGAKAPARAPEPEEPPRPAFTLWPEPPPPGGQLFARSPAPPLPEPIAPASWLSALDLASGDPARLPQTRVRAFGLFGPGSQPCPSRVSLRNATGLRLGLLPDCGGAIKTWLSEDPAGAVDSVNLYAFVGWQPSMGTDPLGRACETEHGGTNRLCNPMDEMELSSDTPWWQYAWAVAAETGGNTLTEALFLNVFADAPHVINDPDASVGCVGENIEE
ncbi:MAG TPA: hypothetical protein VJG13_14540, partial [Thermoanaerobaculia bacterium]|nr:hypothetical protein [Thermoanaerobaculia bacterium]